MTGCFAGLSFPDPPAVDLERLARPATRLDKREGRVDASTRRFLELLPEVSREICPRTTWSTSGTSLNTLILR
jgi:hypothetical protein